MKSIVHLLIVGLLLSGCVTDTPTQSDPPNFTPGVQVRLAHSDEVDTRYKKALELVKAGRYDEALADYAWLWTVTYNRSSAFDPPIRRRIISGIGDLASKHEPTMHYFSEILDSLGIFVRRNIRGSFREWYDWAALSRALGQEARLIELYEKRKTATGSLSQFTSQGTVYHPYAFDDLFEVLLERGRFVDAGRLHANLTEEAEQNLSTWEKFNLKMGGGRTPQRIRERLALLYALGLASDRKVEAVQISTLLLRRFNDAESRRALIAACARVGVSSPATEQWKDEISAASLMDSDEGR